MKTKEIIANVKKANKKGEFNFEYHREGERVEFTAEIGDKKYTAYGTYDSIDVYAVEDGLTQDDVDVVSALLDDAWEPTCN